MKKENVNYLIAKYIFKMGVTILLIVLSYLLISNSTLSSYASTAENYDNNHIATQMSYVNNIETNDVQLLENKKILDGGILSLHNPNKKVETVKVELLITTEISDSIDDLVIVYDGNIINFNYTEKDGYFIILLGEHTLAPLEKKTYELELLTFKNVSIKPFSYNFNIVDEDV